MTDHVRETAGDLCCSAMPGDVARRCTLAAGHAGNHIHQGPVSSTLWPASASSSKDEGGGDLGDFREGWKRRGRELNALYAVISEISDGTPGGDPLEDLRAVGRELRVLRDAAEADEETYTRGFDDARQALRGPMDRLAALSREMEAILDPSASPAPSVSQQGTGERERDLERVARYWLKDSTLWDGLADDVRTDWSARERPWRPNPPHMQHAGQRVIWLTREEWDDIGRVLGFEVPAPSSSTEGWG